MSIASVLASSALLAFVPGEDGMEVVRSRLAGSWISAVTLTESLEVLTRKGDSLAGAKARLNCVVLQIEPFDHKQAELAAALLTSFRRIGLSLGDACCLALAMRLHAEVLTADTAWTKMGLPIAVALIR